MKQVDEIDLLGSRFAKYLWNYDTFIMWPFLMLIQTSVFDAASL